MKYMKESGHKSHSSSQDHKPNIANAKGIRSRIRSDSVPNLKYIWTLLNYTHLN
ncbi:hypothetical protein SAMN05421578_101132 [Paenibacillus macquariensis]|uniref:Uncharacterized protein n=1 Tax=Paenibacillus macquariensis TaxID=948756 RepID=A0ABY1JJM4_9BACL|nr:hypothetical protein SAMN05421578_101132 [Paenibacillus macquariensis]